MTSKNIKIAEMATEKSEEVNEMTNETHPELDELDLRVEKYLERKINRKRCSIETVNQILSFLDIDLVELICGIEQGLCNSDKYDDFTGFSENILANAHEVNNYIYALKTFEELKLYFIKNYGIFKRFPVNSD
jgi:hypothetical protein